MGSPENFFKKKLPEVMKFSCGVKEISISSKCPNVITSVLVLLLDYVQQYSSRDISIPITNKL